MVEENVHKQKTHFFKDGHGFLHTATLCDNISMYILFLSHPFSSLFFFVCSSIRPSSKNTNQIVELVVKTAVIRTDSGRRCTRSRQASLPR